MKRVATVAFLLTCGVWQIIPLSDAVAGPSEAGAAQALGLALASFQDTANLPARPAACRQRNYLPHTALHEMASTRPIRAWHRKDGARHRR